MRRRVPAIAVGGLVALLVSMAAPLAFVLPVASPLATALGERIPTSEIQALPEFTRDSVIPIAYTATGTAGSSGLFWVELYWRVAGEPAWSLYAPPWNPDGRWFGQLGFGTDEMNGTILFDTFFARGEQVYEFYTVAVDRGFKLEPKPGEEAKARTTLDTRPPNLFVASPTPDAWTNRNVFAWVATDEVAGLASVTAALDEVPMDPFDVAPGAKEATGSRPMNLDGEGTHGIAVRATDRAGNAADLFVRFHYDPSAPSLTITAPQRGSYLNTEAADVEWTASDSGAGMASFRVLVNSDPAVTLAGDATGYRITGLEERGYIVTVVAMDAAGNVAAETVTFGVDRTKPVLELVAPRGPDAYSNVRDRLQVLWTGTDVGSGIDHFRVSLVEAGVSSPDLPTAAGYTFEGVAEGVHTVRVIAQDRAGNVQEVTATVTVDWTPPVVSVSSPARGTTVYGDVRVGWSAEDALSGIREVTLIFDGGAPTALPDGETFPVSPRPADGAHVVVVRAWDRAGNMAEATVPFEFRAAAPTPSSLPALDFWLLMLLVGAIAVASAYFAVRRRKKVRA